MHNERNMLVLLLRRQGWAWDIVAAMIGRSGIHRGTNLQREWSQWARTVGIDPRTLEPQRKLA